MKIIKLPQGKTAQNYATKGSQITLDERDIAELYIICYLYYTKIDCSYVSLAHKWYHKLDKIVNKDAYHSVCKELCTVYSKTVIVDEGEKRDSNLS